MVAGDTEKLTRLLGGGRIEGASVEPGTAAFRSSYPGSISLILGDGRVVAFRVGGPANAQYIEVQINNETVVRK